MYSQAAVSKTLKTAGRSALKIRICGKSRMFEVLTLTIKVLQKRTAFKGDELLYILAGAQ